MKNLIKGSITSNLQKTYDVGSQLGAGKFSVVRSGTEKSTGKQWALKIMKRNVVDEQTLVKEVEIMLDVKHTNVIALKEVYETDSDVILILELVTGGELFDKIVERNSYTEEDASKLINTLVRVIQYLHTKDIVHCDLKPENLLYSDNSDAAIIKLCDFGLSQRCPQGTTLRSLVGTATYMAPEISSFSGYGKPADMWSVGVIIYILLCGFPPFDETTGWNLEFPSPEWDNISDSAKDLIKALLTVDQHKRPTAAQTLKHVWVSGITAGKQSIIGTLKTLREFNTLRRTGTTMGHNKTPSRGTVFELFPSLTPSKDGANDTSSSPAATPTRAPIPTAASQFELRSTSAASSSVQTTTTSSSSTTTTWQQASKPTTVPTSSTASATVSTQSTTATSAANLVDLTTQSRSSADNSPSYESVNNNNSSNISGAAQLDIGSGDKNNNSNNNNNANIDLQPQQQQCSISITESAESASATSSPPIENGTGSSSGSICNRLVNSVKISSSNSSSSNDLLKELDQETTTFQETLKKQLMNSLETDNYDTSSDSSTPSDGGHDRSGSVVSPDVIVQGVDIFESEKQRALLAEQLQQQKEVSARLQKELDDLRKATSGNNNKFEVMMSSSLSAASIAGGLSITTSGGSANSSDNEGKSRDKSKYGVDRIVLDLQAEFDRLQLPKDVTDKLYSTMAGYRSKNQERSMKLQLEKQKEKYKKLKAQMKKAQK
ncbi:hypothetical protein SAMD00019534_107290 [Acytostelium subglobosum LB1]|uniref:hypothetical protein n=1 Tax=Acytostelium subglobosum LB1 TaxID=1410327 RepID=UPI0006450AA1|nr:hypothetical protein SAMD00019534_107290 [Acytostelium subglobosum LB1]GAM27553.1 hypothetical protein SAMD00019534_107290 [Acytostelium subglobosum LB1]|eukprot:XP_012749618.1 hypothetical protein SAMD00019534_107290 [Acytostelium subglobosum LB1]